MRQAASIVTFSLLLVVLGKAQANAATSVKIEGNGSGASAKVNIQNSFNSSNTSSNTVDSHTKVRIETNGEVKEYESTNGEDVHMESSDGTSKVNITNKINGSSSSSPTHVPKPTVTGVQEEIDEATSEAQKKVENIKEKQKDFFEKLEELIKNFFANLF